jgi:hypothetical protein
MIQIGESTPDIQLKLFPEGIVEGRILDDAGEPVEGAAVIAMCSQVREGRRRWEQVGSGSADDTGTFRLDDLRPGQYLLYVNASGVHDRKPGQKFDSVFAPSYYPSGATPAEATPISISAGQHVQADFALKRQPGYMISGVVTNIPQGSGAGIFAAPAGAPSTPYMASGLKPNGEFSLGPLPEGDYVLRAQAQSGAIAFGQEIPLAIGHANVANLIVALDPPFEVPVQLSVVRTKAAGQPDQSAYIQGMVSGPVSGRMMARGMPQGAQLGNISFIADENHPFFGQQNVNLQEQTDPQAEPPVVKGLGPGAYRMNTWANGSFYIESARSGDTDLLEAPLVVRSGAAPPPIQITLRDDSANLMVNCAKDSKQQNCAALLVPAHGQPHLLWGYGTSGGFSNGLAPGDYRIYAFDSIAGLEYANPEAMREYSSKGQDFTLEPNEQKTVTLEVIHREGPGAQ